MKHLCAYLIFWACAVLCFPAAGFSAKDIEIFGTEAVQAAEKALAPGTVDACLTNADSAMLDGHSCRILLDLFCRKEHVSIGQGSLLMVHRAWGMAPWAAFISQPDSETLNMVLVRITSQGYELKGPLNIRVNKGTDFTPFNQAFGKEAFSLVTLANGWADKVPPAMLSGSLFHDHLCCGVFTGYFTVRYILGQFPLSKAQSYMYIGAPAWCQDDLIMEMMNLTPGKHGYVTMAYPWNRAWTTADGVYQNLGGIIVRKDGPAAGGQAWVLSFDWQWEAFRKFAGLGKEELDWRSSPWLHAVYNRFLSQYLDQPEKFVSVVKTKTLKTRQDVDALVQLGANPLELLLGRDASWPETK